LSRTILDKMDGDIEGLIVPYWNILYLSSVVQMKSYEQSASDVLWLKSITPLETTVANSPALYEVILRLKS